mmetsp:Transcript_4924/g.14740  ORF Transcript_4924/g.14740 Transcript_4924/m.14740 type:complete len:281 (+) Transcript_4924:2211-3053(+)
MELLLLRPGSPRRVALALQLLVLQRKQVRQGQGEELVGAEVVQGGAPGGGVARSRWGCAGFAGLDGYRHAGRLRRVPQLLVVVGEEAHGPVAARPVRAHLRPVPRGVEPALEHAVGVLAGVAPLARPLPVVRAGLRRVRVLPRVPPPGLLARVGERALGPVMRPCSGARLHLELVHPKVVRAERRVRDVRVRRRRVVVGVLPGPLPAGIGRRVPASQRAGGAVSAVLLVLLVVFHSAVLVVGGKRVLALVWFGRCLLRMLPFRLFTEEEEEDRQQQQHGA